MPATRFGRNLVILLECAVFVVSGALAFFLVLGSLFLLKEPRLDTKLAILFELPLALFFFAFARRSYRSLRLILDGTAEPGEFFSLEWNSGFSFLALAFIVVVLSSIALRARAKLIEKATGSKPRWQDVLR